MYHLKYTLEADEIIKRLRDAALTAHENRKIKNKSKASKQEGLYKQLHKTLQFLSQNPKHPGLNTHEYNSLKNPFNPNEKVFEAYVQNNTPGAYRVFWCYGPNKMEITIVTVTAHP